MGAVIAIILILGAGFTLIFLYAALKIAGIQSRWEEERYRQRKEKHDSNESTKKAQGK